MKKTRNEIKEMLEVAKQQVKDAGIKIAPNVFLADKFMKSTKTYGRSKRYSDGDFEISLSEYYLENSEEEIMETLVHEVLHTVKGCWNHGKKWQALANKMNEIEGYNISRTTSVKMDSIAKQGDDFYRYVVVCKGCNQKIRRQNNSKFIRELESYTCGICGDKFYLED